MAYTVESFLKAVKPYIISDMKSSGILASLTAAQSLIESRHGNSGLTQKANNLFGIKGNYKGQSVTMLTTEYYGGVAYKVNAQFRKYPSWAESIADHSAMFNRMSRYKNLRGCTDWRLACKYVESAGYATSIDPETGLPNYANTLMNAISTHGLNAWDLEVLNSGSSTSETLENGNPYPVPSKNIRLNSKGNDVRWLQFELNRRGYHLIVDGIAGLKTIGALTDFQSKHEDEKGVRLSADGICGPKTIKALLS